MNVPSLPCLIASVSRVFITQLRMCCEHQNTFAAIHTKQSSVNVTSASLLVALTLG